MLIAGLRHLHAVLNEYVTHCNRHRPHRVRELWAPDGGDVTVPPFTVWVPVILS